MISIIVAIDDHNAIGRRNDIPWHLSGDLKRFKALTMGHTVIMGRNTWDSLPFKPLKGRRNIVVSRSMAEREDCEVVRSVEEACARVKDEEEAFVMGGAGIYEQMMEMADRLIVTHVHLRVEDADRFFPRIDPERWEIASREEIMTEGEISFEYIIYNRLVMTSDD